MAGFGMAILGGALEQVGTGIADRGKALREAKLRQLEQEREFQFRSSEAEVGAGRQAVENQKSRDAQAAENEKDRQFKSSTVEAPKPTDDMREYDIARSQGFQGTFMDYLVKMKEAGRQQVNIDTGVKLPTSFRWKNPEDQNAGVEPIPGGPGEQIPGELAARVGVANSFLARLPSIKERVAKGEVTGPIDRGVAGAGYGGQGELFRQIETGADVLQRFLTGAGMPASEAAEYARRYKPTYADTAESMLSKLDQLEQELRSAKEMAMRGRGGDASDKQPTTGDSKPAEDGWTDLGGGVRIRRK